MHIIFQVGVYLQLMRFRVFFYSDYKESASPGVTLHKWKNPKFLTFKVSFLLNLWYILKFDLIFLLNVFIFIISGVFCKTLFIVVAQLEPWRSFQLYRPLHCFHDKLKCAVKGFLSPKQKKSMPCQTCLIAGCFVFAWLYKNIFLKECKQKATSGLEHIL